jgi:hypothetical protein
MRIKILRELGDLIIRIKAIELSKREKLNFKDKLNLFFGFKVYPFADAKTLIYDVGKEEYFIFDDGTKQRFERIYIK